MRPRSDDHSHRFHPVWIQVKRIRADTLGENCVSGPVSTIGAIGAPRRDRADNSESVLGLTPGRQMHSEIMRGCAFISATNRTRIWRCMSRPDLMPRADIASDQVRLAYTS